jgi:Pilus assembly protein, PilO
MAEQSNKSIKSKHVLVDKANQTIVIVTSAAAFVIIFSLVSSKTLFKEMSYQSKVITSKQLALTKLQADDSAANQLVSSYQTFISSPNNLIGGNSTGNGRNDGNNAQIILDALPSQYDFPALITSLTSLIQSQAVSLTGISGTDQILSQVPPTAGTTAPVAMPFSLQVSGNYTGLEQLVSVMQESIRPLQITSLDFTGDQSNLTLSVAAQTYYQPGVKFNITTSGVQ